jgi:hypothetical protein
VSRAHCLDCGTDVPIDPLGHCPEGHLLPAQGRRVESAIGSDDYHPDEPEPWVAQVDPPATARTEDVVPSAEPQAAPGLAPAQRETTTGDLLRELGSLSSRNEPPAGPSPDAGPPSAPSAAATPDTGPSAPPGPAPSSTIPHDMPSVSAGPDAAVAEHSALEQALQSLEDAHEVPGTSMPTEPGTPVASEQPAPAPALDDDLSSLFEELEGLGGDAPGNGSAPAAPATPDTPPPVASQPPTAPPPPAAPPPTAAPAPSQPPTARPPEQTRPTRQALREAGALAGSPPEPQASDEHVGNGHDAPAAAGGLDTMNFTAKGGAMNGRRRRRLLGR